MAKFMYRGVEPPLEYEVDHIVVDGHTSGTDCFVHGYDAKGNLVVAFEGVSAYDLAANFYFPDGFMDPEECLQEPCNNVKFVNEAFVLPDGTVLPIYPSGFASYYTCSTLDELNAKIDELTKAQQFGTEKTYYIYFTDFSGHKAGAKANSLPGGRWSVTIHKPYVSDPEKFAGVTATVVSSRAIYKLQRELYANTWLNWEHENPMMYPGVTYRTPERCNGKQVSVICKYLGSLPSSGMASYQIFSGYPKLQPLSCELFTVNSDGWRYTISNNVDAYVANYDGDVKVVVKVASDHSTHDAYAIVKYFMAD